jgi:hypothetical protein
MVSIGSRTQVCPSPEPDAYGETAGGEHGGAAQAQQYTPQPFSGFNTGQPIGYMQMGGTPGWPPGQVPYAPNTMGTPYQSSIYGMHSQQQYGTPLGPTNGIPDGT